MFATKLGEDPLVSWYFGQALEFVFDLTMV